MLKISLRNLAYLGDAVWELFIREKTTVLTSNAKKLHKITTEKVNASYQAELLNAITNELTEDEKELVRRARNLPIPIGRRQIQNEYRHATSFETLIGWWYIYDKVKLEYIFKQLENMMQFKN